MLEVDSITKSFGGLHVLADVSMRVEAGQIVGLIGPNGAGKTTLLNIVSGYVKADAGGVRIGDQDVLGRSPQRLYRLGMARTFQDGKTFGTDSIAEHFRIARSITGTRTPSDISATLERHLDKLADSRSPATDLPHGTRMLLGLAMATLRDPRILLMDEPLAGLDGDEAAAVLTSMHDLAGRGTAIVLIEHNVDQVVRNCDAITVLDNGGVIAHGTPAEVVEDERVINAYLGAGLDE